MSALVHFLFSKPAEASCLQEDCRVQEHPLQPWVSVCASLRAPAPCCHHVPWTPLVCVPEGLRSPDPLWSVSLRVSGPLTSSGLCPCGSQVPWPLWSVSLQVSGPPTHSGLCPWGSQVPWPLWSASLQVSGPPTPSGLCHWMSQVPWPLWLCPCGSPLVCVRSEQRGCVHHSSGLLSSVPSRCLRTGRSPYTRNQDIGPRGPICPRVHKKQMVGRNNGEPEPTSRKEDSLVIQRNWYWVTSSSAQKPPDTTVTSCTVWFCFWETELTDLQDGETGSVHLKRDQRKCEQCSNRQGTSGLRRSQTGS